MEQVLYKLTPEMVDAANKELRQMDQVDLAATQAEGRKVRHQHRRHVYLPSYQEEQYGILMQNLQGPGIDWLVEFKPKWLVQSPTAPKDSRNCRTCALNASRRRAGKHKGRGDSGFCPFDLLVGPEEDEILSRALQNIWPIEAEMARFLVVFREKVQPALRHLQKLEQKHGSVGLDDFQNPAGKDFGVAMAFRDCSVFLALSRRKMNEGGVDVVDVKFADLDLKSTEGGKIQKWATMEQELLDGGWYYNTKGTDCSLSRAVR
jgi:inositol-pentakisphosphate 2-kinase